MSRARHMVHTGVLIGGPRDGYVLKDKERKTQALRFAVDDGVAREKGQHPASMEFRYSDYRRAEIGTETTTYVVWVASGLDGDDVIRRLIEFYGKRKP